MAKAKKIPYLNPERDLRTCLRKILRTRFGEMVSFEEGMFEGSDIEELHNMRVASRRVQAVMKVFRAGFPKREFRKQYRVIRGIKDVLGVVRHYDVFIDMLEKFVKELSATEKPALELLDIRERALREKEKKEMVRFVRELKRKEYKEKFLEFAGKTD